jgi:hypothetical protein
MVSEEEHKNYLKKVGNKELDDVWNFKQKIKEIAS